MLHADPSSRRRIHIVTGVIACLLGAFMLSGVVQRAWPNRDAGTEAPTAQDLVQLRRDAQEVRDLRRQLVSFAKDARWDSAAEAATRFLDRRENVMVLRMRAEALLRTGDREGAGRDYAKLLGDNPLERASLLAIQGDVRGYRRHCTDWLKRTDVEGLAPLEANNVAWMCVLAPDGLEDYGRPLRLATRAVDRAAAEDRPTYLNTLGVVQYRAGRYEEAVRSLADAEKLREDVFNWVFLAMAHQRLGKPDEAREWLGRVQMRLDSTYGTLSGQDYRQELLMFWREAKALIEPTPETS